MQSIQSQQRRQLRLWFAAETQPSAPQLRLLLRAVAPTHSKTHETVRCRYTVRERLPVQIGNRPGMAIRGPRSRAEESAPNRAEGGLDGVRGLKTYRNIHVRGDVGPEKLGRGRLKAGGGLEEVPEAFEQQGTRLGVRGAQLRQGMSFREALDGIQRGWGGHDPLHVGRREREWSRAARLSGCSAPEALRVAGAAALLASAAALLCSALLSARQPAHALSSAYAASQAALFSPSLPFFRLATCFHPIRLPSLYSTHLAALPIEMEVLKDMFPNHHEDALAAALSSAEGDLEMASALLLSADSAPIPPPNPRAAPIMRPLEVPALKKKRFEDDWNVRLLDCDSFRIIPRLQPFHCSISGSRPQNVALSSL